MAFQNESNRKRVDKMCDILDFIEKSGSSNKVTNEDIAFMLVPLLHRMERYSGIQPATEPENAPSDVSAPPTRIGVTAPKWASILDMCRECSLSELQAGMAVYMDRLDEHFAEIRNGETR